MAEPETHRVTESTASTRSVEAAGLACIACGSEQYLDAGRPGRALRCASCDLADAAEGLVGLAWLDNEGSAVDYRPSAFVPSLLPAIRSEVGWQSHSDRLSDGALVAQPRLIAYQADDVSFVYSYTGIAAPLIPTPLTPAVAALRTLVEVMTGESFNSVHLNLYRTGADHVSWHTDEDAALYGDAPTIASVSFGAEREFVLRRMGGTPYTDGWLPVDPPRLVRYRLGAGDLLVMRGATQRHWEHMLAKTGAGALGEAAGAAERVNLTFRRTVARGPP